MLYLVGASPLETGELYGRRDPARQIMNRTVDATGLQVGRHHPQQHQWIIDALGLDRFPHATG